MVNNKKEGTFSRVQKGIQGMEMSSLKSYIHLEIYHQIPPQLPWLGSVGTLSALSRDVAKAVAVVCPAASGLSVASPPTAAPAAAPAAAAPAVVVPAIVDLATTDPAVAFPAAATPPVAFLVTGGLPVANPPAVLPAVANLAVAGPPAAAPAAMVVLVAECPGMDQFSLCLSAYAFIQQDM